MIDHWYKKRQLLKLLSAKHFVSGEKLAQQMSLSRTAIANHVSGMTDVGVDVYSVKGKGYKLASPISLIDESLLKQNINNRCFYFDEIDSTNKFLLKHIDDLENGDICLAELQTAGRGRRGKVWVSPYASHLYFSMYWQLEQGMAAAMGLSLVVGYSLTTVLTQLGVDGLGLKWPNDIYRHGKKLAGILVEMHGQADGICQLVIGAGVNIAMPKTQQELIDQPWSDLLDLINQFDKTQLAILLQKQLCHDLGIFTEQGLTPFINGWRDFDIFQGQQVQISFGDTIVIGCYQGIDEQGGVIIEQDGVKKCYLGGEITLRAAANK